MYDVSQELVAKFHAAVTELSALVACNELVDENADRLLRIWLDGGQDVLAWTYSDSITPDEWFFVTTLYGEMTMEGQRTHIRKYFPTLFVRAVRRDIRNFVPDMTEYAGLRSRWMSKRLSLMGSILRQRNLTMGDYTQYLRQVERTATPNNPMPALDQIIRDHSATGWKTLSVFVRDCVGGNCFPIDSRVEKELHRHQLPVNERHLMGLALAIGCNPRQIARMFYGAGGQRR